jgi:hypothetical protein
VTNTTKIALATALIAALATPALAQGPGPYYNYPTRTPSHQTQAPFFEMQAPSYATRTPRFIEGRNAAASGNFGASSASPSSREFMVQSLGN